MLQTLVEEGMIGVKEISRRFDDLSKSITSNFKLLCNKRVPIMIKGRNYAAIWDFTIQKDQNTLCSIGNVSHTKRHSNLCD